MGIFNGCLLCSDFDGTFAVSKKIKKDKLHSDNLKMTEYFMDNGGIFVLATGRGVHSISKYMKNFKSHSPTILNNGAELYDFNNNKRIDVTYIQNSWKELVSFVDEKFHDNAMFHILAEDDSYLFGEKSEIDFYLKNIDDLGIPTDNFDNIPDNIVKILIVAEPSVILEIEDFCKTSKFYSDFTIVKSADVMIEIMPLNTSKGKAMEKVAEIYNISMDKTFAIGDFDNDVPMLKSASFSAAVANAQEIAKKNADIIVSSNENAAVAEFIKIIENRLK